MGFRIRSCLSCITEDYHCKPFPDDLWIDVLRRLPAEDLLRCQKVCRHWKILTSTPYFNDLYLNRGAVPVMVVQQISFGSVPKNLLFLEDWDAEQQKPNTSTSKKIRVTSSNKYIYSVPNLEFSHDGLLFFSHKYCISNAYSILNPVTHEQITFDIPCGRMFASFSHPLTKEHYVLLLRLKKRVLEFKMLRLELLVSNNLNSESGWKGSSLSPLLYTVNLGPPIIEKDAIYWMLEEIYVITSAFTNFPACEECILKFDIKNEKLDLISHPGEKCAKLETHRQMHLFEMEGHVSFCKLSFSMEGTRMHIWILEDDLYTWSWKETIILDIPNMDPYYQWDVIPLGTINGELIISNCFRKNLFAYHLQRQTMRKLDWKGSMDVRNGDSYVGNICTHRNNILPLKNNSNIQNQKSKKTCLLSKLKKHVLQWV